VFSHQPRLKHHAYRLLHLIFRPSYRICQTQHRRISSLSAATWFLILPVFVGVRGVRGVRAALYKPQGASGNLHAGEMHMALCFFPSLFRPFILHSHDSLPSISPLCSYFRRHQLMHMRIYLATVSLRTTTTIQPSFLSVDFVPGTDSNSSQSRDMYQALF
jgi:hypothetical protein